MPFLPESLRWLLAAFAVYRLARLVGVDTLTGFVRDWAAKRAAGALPYSRAWLLAELLDCPYCLGVWLAIPVMALALWPTSPGDLFLVWLGLTGAGAFLYGLCEQ